MDTVTVLLHTEAQLLDYGESRTSGPWIKLRLPDHGLLDPFRGMDVGGSGKGTPNLHITIAQGDIAALAAEAPAKAPHSEAAEMLWRSGFFRTPEVWRALGLFDQCEAARQQDIKTAQRLAWNHLKATLGYESMAEVPPWRVREWAREKGVDRSLPNGYWSES